MASLKESTGPLVSVVIPCYNQMEHSRLLVCLTSVLYQTYDKFEVIVVDDASTDGSYELCEEFKLRFRHRLRSHEDVGGPVELKILQHFDPENPTIAVNKGLAASRNLGIYHSQGEYIALLDADDSWSHDKLTRHIAHLTNEATLNIGVSFSRSEYVTNGKDNTKPGIAIPALKLLNPTFEDILFNNPISNGSSPVIKKQVFRDVLINAPNLAFASEDKQRPMYFDESLDRAEDLDCWLRIYHFTNWGFRGIPEVLTYYWYDPNGSSLSSNLCAQELAIQKVIHKLCEYSTLELKELKQLNTLAYAYMYRYLARQACRSYNPMALQYVTIMLQTSLHPLIKEPFKVLKLLIISLALSTKRLLWK